MSEKPILFSAPMVRAILDGAKTQTRRVVKPQPINVPGGAHIDPYDHDYSAFTVWTSDNRMCLHCGGDRKEMAHWRSPYGKPGDHLWVRETWGVAPCYNEFKPSLIPLSSAFHVDYRADPERFRDPGVHVDKWRPSIHMPRWASRILLRVTDIRVERIQNMPFHDIRAEGVSCPTHDFESGFCTSPCADLAKAWIDLWDSINAKRGFGWESNPWVWVVEFERIK